MTELEKLKQQLNEISEKVKQLENPKFEVGKWYKSKDKRKKTLFVLTSFESSSLGFFDKTDGYGFDYLGEWVDSEFNLEGSEINGFIPATDKEVKEALIKEAERRGFAAFARIKLITLDDIVTLGVRGYTYSNNDLYLGGWLIFRDGKWAEIIKDEPIKVGGYAVEKDGSIYKIGCKEIWSQELDYIHGFMSKNKFKKVAFDGIEVSLETIEKILKM